MKASLDCRDGWCPLYLRGRRLEPDRPGLSVVANPAIQSSGIVSQVYWRRHWHHHHCWWRHGYRHCWW